MTQIKLCTMANLPQLIQVHVQAFEGFTLTLLGERFLSILYKSFIDHSDGVALIATDEVIVASGEFSNSAVLGFLVGTKDPIQFFKETRRSKGALFCLAAVPSLLRHPRVISERLWAAFRYQGDAPLVPRGYWLLSSLAVLPLHKNHGIGTKLIERYCQLAKEEAAPGVYLSTDADHNDSTHAFYLGNGFKVFSHVTRRNGRKMIIYAREF